MVLKVASAGLAPVSPNDIPSPYQLCQFDEMQICIHMQRGGNYRESQISASLEPLLHLASASVGSLPPVPYHFSSLVGPVLLKKTKKTTTKKVVFFNGSTHLFYFYLDLWWPAFPLELWMS